MFDSQLNRDETKLTPIHFFIEDANLGYLNLG